MTNLLPYITAGLRFAPDDIPCRPKDSLGRAFSCNYNGEGPAMAIHTWQGRHVCAYHSPFDNKYVPCADCGEKPALMDGEQVCDDCLATAADAAVVEAEVTGHVCDEDAERAAYGRYVDDGLADTDGWYSPEPFSAWQAHYHRAIGHKEPRTEECTETECKAPGHERLHCVQDRIPGKGRRFRTYSVCRDCYDRRRSARAA
ncbi:hypothetical protein [Streptomyces hokutonensis]|uniref:hypothetical protein n=1 Tax=Streptomyces hokutonensis TaxID=1306990 RepID=UPI0036959813